MFSARVVNPLPATEAHTCLWLASMHRAKLKFSTIKVYLYGLRSAHVDIGVSWTPIQSSKWVERIYRGIKRDQGIANNIRPRLPITFDILRAIDRLLDLSRADHRLLRAALWIGTAGLFRIGEFTVSSASTPDQVRLLTLKNLKRIQIEPPVIAIHLRASKTDIYRKEVDVKIANRTAIHALDSYLARRTTSLASDQPLFAFDNGTPVTRKSLLASTNALIAQCGIDTAGYSGISFRRGGATSMSAAGVPDRLIKIFGRWQSWAYARYIETPLQHWIDSSQSL
jgi:hypothetical protein